MIGRTFSHYTFTSADRSQAPWQPLELHSEGYYSHPNQQNPAKKGKAMKVIIVTFFVLFAVLGPDRSASQFAPEDLGERGKWEDFLETAKIADQEQMESRQAVTKPWVLTLEKDGVKKRALWKNPRGRMRGFVENWKWEIAAYRLDKLLALNMVPPTVEKRFQGDRGSCQLWIDDVMSLRHKVENKIQTPPAKLSGWNRAIFIQRAFDNLIANEDRHMNQVLITKDWRMILIDHSRTFRTSKNFTEKLLYDEKSKGGPRLMRELPRAFYEKVKSLSPELIGEAVGEYLDDDEIEAVLQRRDLIVQWVENRIKELGEDKVLY
jgi:hypothetical protein